MDPGHSASPAAAQMSSAGDQQRRWIRPKGYLGSLGLTLLLLLIGATLVMVLARVLAAPGMPLSEFVVLDALRQLGVVLNRTLTLEWVPPADRQTVNYLLLLPTAALLIATTRLTLGLRLLGFRAILLAVGFQEIGLMPSFVIIAAVTGVILLLRPAIRRVRLPLYARIAMYLSLVACVMVAALFAGPWLRSELLWSVAFFPVIILAMMAESLARTLDQSSAASAAARLGSTLAVALLLLALMNSSAVLHIALRFPELMLTQLGAIVLVAEYFDLRLLQGGGGIARWLGYESEPAQNRVAVVRNRWPYGVIAHMGPNPARGSGGSVQHIVDALRDEGYVVRVFEGDMTLLRELQQFLPLDSQTNAPAGIVLNLATGIQGRGRGGHVASMLEMAGVAYTGPDPIGHARLYDRFALLTSLQHAGVPVPPFRLLSDWTGGSLELALPAWISAHCNPDTAGALVKSADEIDSAMTQLGGRRGEKLLVESWIEGTEFRVTVLGNAPAACLPLMRIDPVDRRRECPAMIGDSLADRIREVARRAFHAAGCRDCARIDLKVNASGEPCVVRVQSHNIFARSGSVAEMAAAAGIGWRGLLRQIVECAVARNHAQPHPSPRIDNVVPLHPAASTAGGVSREPIRFAGGANR